EGRIGVHELKRLRREARQQLEIVSEQDLVASELLLGGHRAEGMPAPRWSRTPRGASPRRAQPRCPRVPRLRRRPGRLPAGPEGGGEARCKREGSESS